MSPHKIQTHYRTCNLCEAMCGIAITHQNGEILSISGDEDDPLSQGHICPKATALQDIYHDPDRLKQPLRRTAAGWETISWEDAFEQVTRELKSIQRKYGRDAVAFYQGNPTVHSVGTMLFAPKFFRTLRTKNRYSATSVDQLPHHFAAYFMFGHQMMLPIPDIDRTDFFLIIGANPVVSNGSLMSAPGIKKRLKALRERGGKLVVIDPRHTETAARADVHHFIRPGSDVLFLLGLLHTLFHEELTQPGRLLHFSNGIEAVQAISREFTPERVENIVGIDADIIRRLARDFSAAPSAVCYGRIGASTQQFGALCQWLINVLNIVTGNLDKPGGAMFTIPAIDVVQQMAKQRRFGSYARWTSRVRGLPEFGGELPVAALAEEILTEGEGQVKALITSAGNPALSTPNGAQLERALSQLEFMVSIDYYLNETTRHAHIILPPTCSLETGHYDLIFHIFAVRNTACYSPPLFPPSPGAKHDWQIFRELLRRMKNGSTKQNLLSRVSESITDRFTPEMMLDISLRSGPYGRQGNRFLTGNGLTLGKLKKHPHGIDLGALTPCLPKRLFTVDKQIHLAPPLLVKDMERVRSVFFGSQGINRKEESLSLVGRRQLRSNNSWMHNSQRLVKGKERCTLLMHPEDASKRGIEDGQLVEVKSRVGKVRIKVECTTNIMPGVVSIPHGWGHHRKGIRLQVASEHAGISINDLTDELEVDQLTGNAAFNGVPVFVIPISNTS